MLRGQNPLHRGTEPSEFRKIIPLMPEFIPLADIVMPRTLFL